MKRNITMTPNGIFQLINDLGNILKEGNSDFLRKSVEKLYNTLMNLEIETITIANRYLRTPDRTTSKNGTRQRPLETTAGMIDLAIPKLRNGNYMPSLIEPHRMTVKALASVIQEAYINGVSNRKVDNFGENMELHTDKSKVSRLCKKIDAIVSEFRNRSLSKKESPYLWLDTTFPKVREGGMFIQ